MAPSGGQKLGLLTILIIMCGCVASNDAIVPEAGYEDALVQTSVSEKGFIDDLSEAGATAGSWGNNQVPDEGEHSKGWATLPASIAKKREIPRRDFHFRQVSRDFCGGPPYKPTKKCSEKYQESMLMVSFPVFIFAFLVLLIGLCIIMGRYCFCCSTSGSGWCGGRLPSQGCCYGELLEADSGYSDTSVKVYTFLVFLVFLLVTIGMFIGFMANAKLTTGIASLLDLAKTTPQSITTQIHGVTTEIASLRAQAAIVNPHLSQSMFQEVTSGLAKIANATSAIGPMIHQSLGRIKGYEADRSSWTYLAFWIPFLLAALGIIGIFCPVIHFILTVPVTALLGAAVLFVLAGHVPIAVLTADFCVGLDYGLKHANASTPIDMLMTCPQQSPGTEAGLHGSMSYFEEASSNAACFILNTTLCPMAGVAYTTKQGGAATLTPFNCPKTAAGAPLPCNAATVGTILNKTIVHDFRWGCSGLAANGTILSKQCRYGDKSAAEVGCLKTFGNTNVRPCAPDAPSSVEGVYRQRTLFQCGVDCLMNATRLSSFKAVGNQALSVSFGSIYTRQLEPLLQCSFMRRAAVGLEHTLCHGVVDATDYMIVALALIGVSLFFGNFVYLGGHKRFHRGYSAENWEETRSKFTTGDGEESSGMPLLGEARA